MNAPHPKASIELIWGAIHYQHSIDALAGCMVDRIEALEPDDTMAALEQAKQAIQAMRDGIAAMASESIGKLETAQGMIGRWCCDNERAEAEAQ